MLGAMAILLPGQTALAQVDGEAAAATCQEVEPRSSAFFAGLEATPEAEKEQTTSQGTPKAGSESLATLEGEAVEEAAIEAIDDLYQHLIACLNDGDFLRAYALYTDDYLLRNLSAEAIGQLDATPVPTEESTRSEFRGVIDARESDGGQIVALVMVNNPQSGDIIIRSTLTEGDDGLRIEDESIVEALDQGESAGAEDTEATPSG
jgi:hypothetical protein